MPDICNGRVTCLLHRDNPGLVGVEPCPGMCDECPAAYAIEINSRAFCWYHLAVFAGGLCSPPVGRLLTDVNRARQQRETHAP